MPVVQAPGAVQVYSSTGVQQYSSTVLQQYISTAVHCTAVQQYSCTTVQLYNSTAVQQYSSTAVQQYISTAVQQCSCTAVQYYCCTADHHSQFPYTVKTCHQLLKYRHCIVGNPCIKSQFLDVPCTNVLNLSKILLCFMNIRPAAFLRDSSATAHRH